MCSKRKCALKFQQKHRSRNTLARINHQFLPTNFGIRWIGKKRRAYRNLEKFRGPQLLITHSARKTRKVWSNVRNNKRVGHRSKRTVAFARIFVLFAKAIRAELSRSTIDMRACVLGKRARRSYI